MNYNLNVMKKITGLVVAALLISTNLIFAQPGKKFQDGGPKEEKIEAFKIGFLTKRLDLTPEEAKVFWPVFNKYTDELKELRKNRRKALLEAREDFSSMPEKDVEKLVDNEMAFRQSELDIMKKYHAQFKQVLPIKKVAILYKTEEDFKRELLQRLKERKQGRAGMRPGGPPEEE